MINNLKNILDWNVTDRSIKPVKKLTILAMTTFWNKCNFSAIVKYYGVKYYCYYDNKLNTFVVENY